MTNSLIFEEQLAINTYWKNIPVTVMLPGTNRVADRFVRASYYINAIPKTDDTRAATVSVFSVIRNCSLPLGISSPTKPNISSTRWRTLSDHKNCIYYFDNVLNPNLVWLDLKKIDFKANSEVRKLSLANNENYYGESNNALIASKPIQFAGLC
jgi:choloylglycine hydrolase